MEGRQRDGGTYYRYGWVEIVLAKAAQGHAQAEPDGTVGYPDWRHRTNISQRPAKISHRRGRRELRKGSMLIAAHRPTRGTTTVVSGSSTMRGQSARPDISPGEKSVSWETSRRAKECLSRFHCALAVERHPIFRDQGANFGSLHS
jgi:hypothetical protein